MDQFDLTRLYREHYGRILASLIRGSGSFELAEDALQDAFAVAVEQWPREGVPNNPAGWLASTARHKLIDRARRQTWFANRRDEIQRLIAFQMSSDSGDDADTFPDERLRLIFTCCHPAINREAQVALSLRTLCGLSTEEIARAFLTPATTMAQRIVRAQQKIRRAGIPYAVPSADALPERLESVMAVIYLVFNEGYSASAGDELVRRDLCAEAIRLARILVALMPHEPEARGLLALMLLHDSRRDTRCDKNGDLVLLEDQDRSRWDHRQIVEGLALMLEAMRAGKLGPYAIQAAIASEHARARRAEDTDWARIAQLYAILLESRPSSIVALNYAVAAAMAYGAERGLALIEEIEASRELDDYYFMWSAKADLLRRLGRMNDAASAYRRALTLVTNAPDRRFLKRRLAEVEVAF
ncbi:MAG TPA: RNA polymerase sigma factor [Candidatus Binataceae bacterium]|nr:RNA polymerase sigma factor [Candidatus Binataceae bacterium]